MVFGPARAIPAVMVIDLAIPIHPVQVEPGRGRPVASLVLVAPLTAGLSDLLAVDPQVRPGGRRVLLQHADGQLQRIEPGAASPITAVTLEDRKSGVEGKGVSLRVDTGGGRSIKKKKHRQ